MPPNISPVPMAGMGEDAAENDRNEAQRHRNEEQALLEPLLSGFVCRMLRLILGGVLVNQRGGVVIRPARLGGEGADSVVDHRRENDSDAECECELLSKHM